MSREYTHNRKASGGNAKADASTGVPEKNNLEYVQKRKAKAKRENTLIAVLILFIITAIGVYLCYAKLFKIKKFSIEGDCPYTEEEMMEGMGIAFGDTLYSRTDKEIKQDVKYNLAYIDEMEISRIWPSTLEVKVEKAKPTFYISMNESMYILSQSLRVLSRTESIQDVELENLVNLEVQGINSCVEGEFLLVENEMDVLLKELYEFLEKYGVFNEITNIDITDRFDMRLYYGTKYEIKLGDKVNLEKKIKFMITVIDEKKTDGESGIIDVSDPEIKQATFENFT